MKSTMDAVENLLAGGGQLSVLRVNGSIDEAGSQVSFQGEAAGGLNWTATGILPM